MSYFLSTMRRFQNFTRYGAELLLLKAIPTLKKHFVVEKLFWFKEIYIKDSLPSSMGVYVFIQSKKLVLIYDWANYYWVLFSDVNLKSKLWKNNFCLLSPLDVLLSSL